MSPYSTICFSSEFKTKLVSLWNNGYTLEKAIFALADSFPRDVSYMREIGYGTKLRFVKEWSKISGTLLNKTNLQLIKEDVPIETEEFILEDPYDAFTKNVLRLTMQAKQVLTKELNEISSAQEVLNEKRRRIEQRISDTNAIQQLLARSFTKEEANTLLADLTAQRINEGDDNEQAESRSNQQSKAG